MRSYETLGHPGRARHCPNMTKRNALGRYIYTAREYTQELANMRGGDIFMGALRGSGDGPALRLPHAD
jgi:hypothetical protein